MHVYPGSVEVASFTWGTRPRAKEHRDRRVEVGLSSREKRRPRDWVETGRRGFGRGAEITREAEEKNSGGKGEGTGVGRCVGNGAAGGCKSKGS